MKEYDKEKLHEHAKELFALCLEKGLDFNYHTINNKIIIGYRWGFEYKRVGCTYISEKEYTLSANINERRAEYSVYPIWELIEKVKQL